MSGTNLQERRRGLSLVLVIPILMLGLGGILVGLQWFGASGVSTAVANSASESNDELADGTIEIASFREAQVWQRGKFITTVPSEVSHEFLIFNDSDDALELADFERSCGCTDLEFESEVIGPGEIGSVRATMSLVGAGPRSTTILLNWKNGEQTSLTIAASVVVPVTVKVTPRRVNLGPNEASRLTVTLVRLDDGEFPATLHFAELAPGLTLRAEAWELVSKGDRARLVPRRYQATVQIERSGEAIDGEIRFQLAVEGVVSESLVVYPTQSHSEG